MRKSIISDIIVQNSTKYSKKSPTSLGGGLCYASSQGFFRHGKIFLNHNFLDKSCIMCYNKKEHTTLVKLMAGTIKLTLNKSYAH